MTPEMARMKAVPTSTPGKPSLEEDIDSPRGGEAKRVPSGQDRILNLNNKGGIVGIKRIGESQGMETPKGSALEKMMKTRGRCLSTPRKASRRSRRSSTPFVRLDLQQQKLTEMPCMKSSSMDNDSDFKSQNEAMMVKDDGETSVASTEQVAKKEAMRREGV